MFKFRCGRDTASGQAVPQAGFGQLRRFVHRRIHVAAGAATEPLGPARHRHLRRRRQRGGGLQRVHPRSVAVQRQGRQALQAALRFSDLRHGQRRLHLQRRAFPGAEDDGGQQPEGHAAAADRGQDHPVRGQGRGRQDLLRGVLLGGGQHGHPQEDGGGRLGALEIPLKHNYINLVRPQISIAVVSQSFGGVPRRRPSLGHKLSLNLRQTYFLYTGYGRIIVVICLYFVEVI